MSDRRLDARAPTNNRTGEGLLTHFTPWAKQTLNFRWLNLGVVGQLYLKGMFACEAAINCEGMAGSVIALLVFPQ